jgi:uncharacterized cupredoxin-like copper-binding protein
MTRTRRSVLAVILAGALAGAGGGVAFALAARSGGRGGDGLSTVVVTVRHSRFSPDRIRVPAGTAVHFVIRNQDPIAHEFILGPPAVHERHERGTEARHGAVPGEVSVGNGEQAETTYVFREPGTVVFACHLPGHFAYGMRGEVVVTPQ